MQWTSKIGVITQCVGALRWKKGSERRKERDNGEREREKIKDCRSSGYNINLLWTVQKKWGKIEWTQKMVKVKIGWKLWRRTRKLREGESVDNDRQTILTGKGRREADKAGGEERHWERHSEGDRQVVLLCGRWRESSGEVSVNCCGLAFSLRPITTYQLTVVEHTHTHTHTQIYTYNTHTHTKHTHTRTQTHTHNSSLVM